MSGLNIQEYDNSTITNRTHTSCIWWYEYSRVCIYIYIYAVNMVVNIWLYMDFFMLLCTSVDYVSSSQKKLLYISEENNSGSQMVRSQDARFTWGFSFHLIRNIPVRNWTSASICRIYVENNKKVIYIV